MQLEAETLPWKEVHLTTWPKSPRPAKPFESKCDAESFLLRRLLRKSNASLPVVRATFHDVPGGTEISTTVRSRNEVGGLLALGLVFCAPMLPLGMVLAFTVASSASSWRTFILPPLVMVLVGAGRAYGMFVFEAEKAERFLCRTLQAYPAPPTPDPTGPYR